jgi:CheY-like chemotaxis protein
MKNDHSNRDNCDGRGRKGQKKRQQRLPAYGFLRKTQREGIMRHSEESKRLRIMLIEDNDRLRNLMKMSIEGRPYACKPKHDVTALPSCNAGVSTMMQGRRFDLIIVDSDHHDMDLTAFKTFVRSYDRFVPIFFAFTEEKGVAKCGFVKTPNDRAIDKFSLCKTVMGPRLINDLIRRSDKWEEELKGQNGGKTG